MQLLNHLLAERVLRKHSLHCAIECKIALIRHQILVLRRTEATRVARVTVIELLFQLLAGKDELIRVYDNHIIARIYIGRVFRLMLTNQNCSNLARQTAEGLSFRIDDIPLFLEAAVCHICFHEAFLPNLLFECVCTLW